MTRIWGYLGQKGLEARLHNNFPLGGNITFVNDTAYSAALNDTNWIPYNNSEGDVISRLEEVEPDLRIHHPVLAVVLAFFCVATVFGNVLVMVAVSREQYLHTVTNFFVCSLATADCLVGAVVMPFSAVHEVMDKYWVFGQDWCDVWHSFDVLASTASILNLCVISLDRYWAITDPIAYPGKMTRRRARLLIALVWVSSSLISFPAIAWWRSVSPGFSPPYQCIFTDDIGYLVFSSTISFYGPLMVMVFTYYRIYRAAVEQTRSLKLGTKHVQCNGESCQSLTLRIHRGGAFQPAATYKAMYPVDHYGSSAHVDEGIDRNSLRIAQRNMKSFSISRKLAKFAKERKAAKTLGIVMGVFILCWLPFFIVNVLMGICGEDCVFHSELVFSVVTWLGWINSSMNPVIYVCWSRDFRRAFSKLLCACCPRQWRKRRRYRPGLNRKTRSDATSSSLKSNVVMTEDIPL